MSFDLERWSAADAIGDQVICAGAAIDEMVAYQSIVPSRWGKTFARVALAAFDHVYDGYTIPTALEIGTAHGMSSSVLALCGFHVDTWDVKLRQFQAPLWKALGVDHAIKSYMRQGPLPVNRYSVSFIDALHDIAHLEADWTEVAPLLHQSSVAIFDDIRFSKETKELFLSIPGAIDCDRFGYAVLGPRRRDSASPSENSLSASGEPIVGASKTHGLDLMPPVNSITCRDCRKTYHQSPPA